jgi:hypothetical protein
MYIIHLSFLKRLHDYFFKGYLKGQAERNSALPANGEL